MRSGWLKDSRSADYIRNGSDSRTWQPSHQSFEFPWCRLSMVSAAPRGQGAGAGHDNTGRYTASRWGWSLVSTRPCCFVDVQSPPGYVELPHHARASLSPHHLSHPIRSFFQKIIRYIIWYMIAIEAQDGMGGVVNTSILLWQRFSCWPDLILLNLSNLS